MRKKAKPLCCVVLRHYREQVARTLHFDGGWSGYWTVKIGGVKYISERVSGLRAVLGKTGNFIQDAILDHVRMRKSGEDFSWSYERDRRYVYEDGHCEWWHW